MSTIFAHKFGGTSMGSAEKIKKVADLIRGAPGNGKVVVVSAMSKVTDLLISAVTLAADKNHAYADELEKIRQKHYEAIDKLLVSDKGFSLKREILGGFEIDISGLEQILRGVFLVGSFSEETLDLVSGMGELWSSAILRSYLNLTAGPGEVVHLLDSRKIIVTSKNQLGPVIHWEESLSNLNAYLPATGGSEKFIYVAPGFVAAGKDGRPTTLGRNGSDFSGSIFAKLFKAEDLTIWTDVSGVLSADPRVVPGAVVIPKLSYSEATELAYFGAKVVHPATMAPAVAGQIPVKIKNTFDPDHPGSVIDAAGEVSRDMAGLSKLEKTRRAVKGFTTINEIALVNVEGTGLIGIPGMAGRLFTALKEIDVSVILISQASSEHSICLAVPASEGEAAESAIKSTFFSEIHHKQIERIDVNYDSAVIAAIGDGMKDHPGVAALLLSALAKEEINVKAVVQGSSERNISLVVAKKDITAALNYAHDAFFSPYQTVNLFVLGTGSIGGAFLHELERVRTSVQRSHGIDLKLAYLGNSSKFLDGRDLVYEPKISAAGQPGHPLIDRLKSLNHLVSGDLLVAKVRACTTPKIVIDLTASSEVGSQYQNFIMAGAHLVCANKKYFAESSGQEKKQLMETARNLGLSILHEASVGAGLPVLSTIKSMIDSGDRIHRITGLFSGSLSYLMEELNQTAVTKKRFSDILLSARALGYTEPDPRDDLSGMDVLRKLMILAGAAGIDLSREDIKVTTLYPDEMNSLTGPEFLAEAESLNAAAAKLFESGTAATNRWRYVGVLSSDEAYAKPVSTEPGHPLHTAAGSNVFCIYSDRFKDAPLIISGPGAGTASTVYGVFSDLLTLVAGERRR